jgi:lipopolysaccharide export system protein LptC
VKWADGTISADKLRITGGGEVVRFEGNVVMNLDKLGDPAAPPQPAAAAPATPEPAAHPAKTRSVVGKSSNPK